MKKIMFFVLAAIATSFISCDGTASNTAVADSDSVVVVDTVDTVQVDTVTADTILADTVVAE